MGTEIPRATQDIVPDGDVLLLVGPDKKKLFVHSLVLSNASKVFRAMFGPNFREGQHLASGSLDGVPLPDDDADAIRTLCNVIHLRNKALPEYLAPYDVLQVAIAADKYECVEAIQLASRYWLKPVKHEEALLDLDMLDFGWLMSAAYLLDDAKAFSEITREMMMERGDSYLDLADSKDIGPIVPWKVFCELSP